MISSGCKTKSPDRAIAARATKAARAPAAKISKAARRGDRMEQEGPAQCQRRAQAHGPRQRPACAYPGVRLRRAHALGTDCAWTKAIS